MQQDMDDLRQELSAERKRADGAEARMRKLGVRNVELSESLRAAKGEAQLGLAESQRAAAERQGPTGEGWEKAKARLQQSLSSVKVRTPCAHWPLRQSGDADVRAPRRRRAWPT